MIDSGSCSGFEGNPWAAVAFIGVVMAGISLMLWICNRVDRGDD